MSQTPGSTRILVAEDDPALRRLIDMLLTNQGYDVHTVADGADALAAVEDWEPDALVVDVMMPRISGLTVCRELRASVRYATVPIILLTARVFDEDIQEVLDLGGIEFMSKPFNPRQLVAVLERLTSDPPADGTRAPVAAARPGGWALTGDDTAPL
jgi:DNA-binding response OmpR family regulator